MLSVSKLSIDYGSNRVVSELNLSLGESEILMLVGPTSMRISLSPSDKLRSLTTRLLP